MSVSSWVETLITSQVDGATLSSSSSTASLLPSAARLTLPEGYFDRLGKELFVSAAGRISNIASTPGTITLDVRFGSTVVASSGAVSLNTTAKTNVSWLFEMVLTCRSLGASGAATLYGIGKFVTESVVGSASGVANTAMCPASSPSVGNGFDSTAAQVIDLVATFSVGNANNSITAHQYAVISRN